jgi:adenylosuccinate synthase
MPTELHDETGEFIRECAHEYGTTTGRARRCGWFDAVAGKFTVRINGFTEIALTRLDVLDMLPTVKVCVGYQANGRQLEYFPSDVDVLEQCEPIYEELPGWLSSTNEARHLEDLPEQARQYIRKLEEVIGCSAGVISVGPHREQSIFAKGVGSA